MELHICGECAKHKTDEQKQQLNISDFLSSLVNEPKLEEKKASLICSFCGFSLYDFKKKGRLGCAKCYVTFRIYLKPLLKKIHGSTHHKGKLPSKVKDSVVIDNRLQTLRDRLKVAIELEEYEEAAHLRDEIRKLENRIKSKDTK